MLALLAILLIRMLYKKWKKSRGFPDRYETHLPSGLPSRPSYASAQDLPMMVYAAPPAPPAPPPAPVQPSAPPPAATVRVFLHTDRADTKEGSHRRPTRDRALEGPNSPSSGRLPLPLY